MWQKSYDGSPSVFIVPTPIGNLDDMTFRAIDILKKVEVIFSEDTRVTLQLLNHFDIKKKLISLHDHNESIVKNNVLSYLNDGYDVAIVTDRGTPIISDPGYKTVEYIKDNGFNVICLPGACAFVPAIVMSSIDSQHFIFYGFLDSKESKMRKELQFIKDYEYATIIYEAPHRIINTLNIMLEILGDRKISISKEISKLHESVFVGKISEALTDLSVFKGEFVIVISPSSDDSFKDISVIDAVNNYIKCGLTSMDAIKKVARERHVPKSEIYDEYHKG